MKFLTYAALIASTVAVRLQSTQQSAVSVDKHVPSPQEIWEHFDKNGDNQWDLAEAQAAFKGGMEYFGHQLPHGWRKMVAAEFKRADTDGSGTVDPKEMGMYIFKAVDADDDGEIQLDELLDSIEAIAKFTGNELVDGWKGKVTQAVSGVDTDASGGASPKELWAAIEKHGFPDINDLFKQKGKALKLRELLNLVQSDIEKVWKHFDKNGDGMWSLKETQAAAVAAFEHSNRPVPKELAADVAAGFKKADKDGNGQVSAHEMAMFVFHQTDADKNGKLSLQEIEGALEWVTKFAKQKLVADWKDQVAAGFKATDTNKDGGLTPEEIGRAVDKHGIPSLSKLWQ